MSKSRPKHYFVDDEVDYSKSKKRWDAFKDKRKEKRRIHALKTKNIDEYISTTEDN
jgi:hypothetical protein